MAAALFLFKHAVAAAPWNQPAAVRSLDARSREPDMVTAKDLLCSSHGRCQIQFDRADNRRLDSLGPKNGRAIYPYGGFPVEKSSFRSNFRFISISPDQTLASLASLALIRLRAISSGAAFARNMRQ